MADLHVVGVLTAKPGSEQIVRAALNGLVEPTRAEAGCISYDLFASDVAFGTYITVELWRSQHDLDAHLQTSHVQEALGVAGEHLTDPPAIHPLTAVAAPGTPHPSPTFDDDDVQQEETPSRSSG
jgi:quinol monooxygenase YgiN